MLELTDIEIAYIRMLLHKDIMQQNPGKYTTGNDIAKKIDKYLDVGVEE